jgi:hypothetical protein
MDIKITAEIGDRTVYRAELRTADGDVKTIRATNTTTLRNRVAKEVGMAILPPFVFEAQVALDDFIVP